MLIENAFGCGGLTPDQPFHPLGQRRIAAFQQIELLQVFRREASVARHFERADPIAGSFLDADLHQSLAALAIDDQGVPRDAHVDVAQSRKQRRQSFAEVADELVFVELAFPEPPEPLGLDLHRRDHLTFLDRHVAHDVDAGDRQPPSFINSVGDANAIIVHLDRVDPHLRQVIPSRFVRRIDARPRSSEHHGVDRTTDQQIDLITHGPLRHVLRTDDLDITKNRPFPYLDDGQHLLRHTLQIAEQLDIVE